MGRGGVGGERMEDEPREESIINGLQCHIEEIGVFVCLFVCLNLVGEILSRFLLAYFYFNYLGKSSLD